MTATMTRKIQNNNDNDNDDDDNLVGLWIPVQQQGQDNSEEDNLVQMMLACLELSMI